jgi:hypothetical protein
LNIIFWLKSDVQNSSVDIAGFKDYGWEVVLYGHISKILRFHGKSGAILLNGP